MSFGEKPTKYFFDLEKRNSVAKTITRLNIDDNIVTNPKEILNAQRDFYKNLYSAKSSNVNMSNQFLDQQLINKLNDVQSESCEGQITLHEVKDVLYSMANNKSPGSDGFTVEFYNFFLTLTLVCT